MLNLSLITLLRYISILAVFTLQSSALSYEYITAAGVEKKLEHQQGLYVYNLSQDVKEKPSSKPPLEITKKYKENVSAKKNRCLANNKYQTIIQRISNRYLVDKFLVTAIIAAESCFNPKAISPKGAEGLMQLMPFTAKRFNVHNSFDPMQNIQGGVQYIKFLLQYFKGNIPLAIAAYNAGEGAVKKYQSIPPYKETQNYVRKVMLMLPKG